MSYILDALRKAEQERHLGQPPTLTTAPPETEPARNRFWYGLTILGLGLNAVLLAFLLGGFRLMPQASPVAIPSPSVPSAPLAPRPLPPASEVSEGIGPPAAPRKEPASQAMEFEPSLPARAPASRERPPEPAPPTAAPSPVASASAPELETLSADARRGIPAFNLDIHVYSADADKRFVVINGRHYREGERLSEGPVLENVVRDGAILRQGDRRFRLSVRR
ncbi:MAG: general secretion pathway protein GspB [Candidatus Competibacter sp.]|nr:general secretion pathway protein GspB [Candidatus Competibacter sp.]MDG4584870.1 general secretion pathway protein GspB [Candidatus Competibacter sp.]